MDADMGWVINNKGLDRNNWVTRLAEYTFIVRRVSVSGEDKTISSGPNMPRSKWPNICALKSRGVQIASGPVMADAEHNTPIPKQA
ncbi:hypothetical protein J45TS6_21190 [Paenibacillus sp. J45TS6]|nr:hypothetical protein J45TS6_21190 [Paenibacillus sp. J45TS6]